LFVVAYAGTGLATKFTFSFLNVTFVTYFTQFILCTHKKLSTSAENVALLGVLNRVKIQRMHYETLNFVVPEVSEYKK